MRIASILIIAAFGLAACKTSGNSPAGGSFTNSYSAVPPAAITEDGKGV